jgi:beta-galactosidase
VEEWAPYPDGRKNTVRFGGRRVACDHWCDLLHLDGAKALGTYGGDFFTGRPAVTRNTHGRGAAYYLGTRLDATGLDLLLERVTKEAAVKPVLRAPAGVEATLRESRNHRYLFLLNYTDRATNVVVGELQGRDLITGAATGRVATLPPLGAAVVQSKS